MRDQRPEDTSSATDTAADLRVAPADQRTYYRALVERRPEYEGTFFVGVTSTGVFCRPTCPARKPRFEHCEFFRTAQQALLAAYRPCKRCRPLEPPGAGSDVVRALVAAVEEDPARRWTDADFRALGAESSTVRRHFKRRFGMTFVAYARSRRMGLAMREVRAGRPVIDAQQSIGFESGSGFRDAFTRIMGAPPAARDRHLPVVEASWIDTPLGPMIAVADETALHLLEFVDRRGLEREIERLRERHAIVPGRAGPVERVERELADYFAGRAHVFETPLALHGTPFQREVWQLLRTIPPGRTWSYADLAVALGRPAAVRAVARANGANQLAIVVPCHRVVRANGDLGGYAGGVARKAWLIEHERSATTTR